MNAEQAKKMSLPAILDQLGHQPVKTLKSGRELWYKSPFRAELDASFHTSFLGGKWIWNDFGDTGGTVVDFAMRYYQADVRGALVSLGRLVGAQHEALFLAPEPSEVVGLPVAPAAGDTLVLRRICPLGTDSFNGRALLQYVCGQRGIAPELAMRYLHEVNYHNTDKGKAYFAVGMANQAQGYEIRNAYFKGSLGQKDVSLIPGNGNGLVAVFEGFMDFLSALTHYQAVDARRYERLARADVLVMHSAAFQRRTVELLGAGSYERILLFVDNDPTGQKVRARLEAEFAGTAVDCSQTYRDYKDFNAFLLAQRPAPAPAPQS